MTDDLDLEERRLCPDGACIGVIGADGRCKVCGRVDDGAPQAVATLDEPLRSADADADADADAEEAEGAPAEAPDGDDDDRRLCPDGNCIGLIGPDGRCKVCGASASF